MAIDNLHSDSTPAVKLHLSISRAISGGVLLAPDIQH